jgi:hypothetical protein
MKKMVYLIIGVLIIGGTVYFFANLKKTKNNFELENNLTKNTQPETELQYSLNDSLTYSEKLNKTKELYPFAKWRENFF